MRKKNKIPRYLTKSILELALKRNKMAFIAGPRQIGKTTEAHIIGEFFDNVEYFNWDQTKFKKEWTRNPDQIVDNFNLAQRNKTRLLVLDEIHKSKSWKQKIKGIYDINHEVLKIIVTGSARLNVYRKGSDSLMGRYIHFRLHPFSYKELIDAKPTKPNICFNNLFKKKPVIRSSNWTILESLYKFSGFPEPYLAKKKNILNICRKDRNEKTVKEDLRDLTRIKEISLVEVLLSILPEKVSSPLSIQSLREDLDVAHDTVTRWLEYLKELYVFFEIKPYSKNIPRSLKKEGKIYFYDWTENINDGAKFENFIASHLLKACHYWEDTGEGKFSIYYLRNKEKQEVDFILIRDGKPWFTVECKSKDSSLDTTFTKFKKFLSCPHIQVVNEENIYRKIKSDIYIMGADYFLINFV